MTLQELISLCINQPVVAQLLLGESPQGVELILLPGLRQGRVNAHRGMHGMKVSAHPDTWAMCQRLARSHRTALAALISAGRGRVS